MTDHASPEMPHADQLGVLYSETPWLMALTTHEGVILALSRPLQELLNVSDQALAGNPFEALVLESERRRVRALFGKLARGGGPQALRAHLARHERFPVAVELEVLPLADDAHQRVTVVVYPISIMHRRERLILEFNLLAPHLLGAQSPAELFASAARALEPLGMGMLVLQLETNQTMRLEYLGLSASLVALLQRATSIDLARVRLPHDAPFFSTVITRRAALFVDDFQALFQALVPRPAAEFYQVMLQLSGIPGCILAPLLVGSEPAGVLMVWSHVLDRDQAPFIEAFAHQLAAVLAQIELRGQTHRQMQRLNSLATTAHAVTTLGSLDEVLRVVCEQAQELLGASFARIAAPVEAGEMLQYIMSSGEGAGSLLQIMIPIASSVSGGVFLSGQSRVIADLRAAEDVYPPFRTQSPARSALYQPLRHRETILGILIVGHPEVGYFNQADLDYVGRYAEYAAVAIANAQLHAALQRSEREQQRQRRELEALLAVSQAINSSLDLDTILQAGLRSIDRTGLASMCAVILLAPDRSGVATRAQRGIPGALLALHSTVLGDPAVVRDICAGRVVRLPDHQIGQAASRLPQARELRPIHMIFVPLIADGQSLGSLELGRMGQADYTEREIELLGAIAAQLAEAIAKATVHETLRATAGDNARLYREAEEVRSYLNALVRNTPDLLLTIRPDMTIHVLNPERVLSSATFSAEEMEGRSFQDVAPEHLRGYLSELWRHILSGRPQSFELELPKATGGSVHMLFSAALIADYGEVFVIVKDVTEQRQRERYLRQNEKLAALGGMVAGAAHELNNPLAAILGLAQLQVSENLPDELRDDMLKIERAALRARSIVQQLLRFASPQPPQKQPVPIERLVVETLERLEQTLRAIDIQVVLEIDPALPPANGDPHQLEQVLFNILHNAAQSLGANPPERLRQLAVHASCEHDIIHLTISDTGPGIAQEHLSRIFDPFFTTRAIGQGTGLGLAISHAIVQQHNGRIWAKSQPGQGASFFLQLPASLAAEPAAPPDEAPAPAHARILLVEDEALVRQVIERTLTRHGYHVDTVVSGVEALDRALGHAYQLIISDLRMPGLDGPTLHARLHQQRPDIRWMIITGDFVDERSHRFLEHTGLAVLPKPFTSAQLLSCVAECLKTA